MAREIPESMPSQVKLDNTVGQAPYSVSFDNAAMKETLLGELGSTIAQNSANALSTKMGYAEGMNPHGDILPPITEADKHYRESYLAQSKNVLGLQLNKMMSDAQTELSKAYRITPGMISDFQKEIGQGASQVLENAPTGVKQELGTQYANAIISTTGALNRRMIGQNKEEAISNMKVADKNTDTAILDNAATGNDKLSHDLYLQKVAQNKKQRSTGMMTPLEEQTSNTSAKLSYYSGISNAHAIAARNKKGDALGKYLAGFTDLKNKPADLSFSEWNTIGNNTLGLMRHMDALQQTDKNLIMSELHEKLAMGDLTEQDILTAYESPSVNRTDLNELLTKMYSSRGKASTKAQKVQGLTENFSSATAFGEATGETINETYSGLVQAAKDKNPNLSPMEAEASIAAMAGGSIPRFLNTVGNLSKSNNLDDVMAASNAYHRVQSVSPQNVIGLNEDAYNFISAFDSFRQQNPSDPMTALAQTRNALINRSPEEKKAVDETWNEVYRKKYSTPEQRHKLARTMLGTDTYFNSTFIQNQAVTQDHITNMLEKNVRLLGGDLETAKTMTEKAVKNVYGDTWVNGRHEMGYLSVEKIAGLDQGGTFFVQKDVVNQVQSKLGMYKEAYDAGHSDYFYRIKNPEKYDLQNLKTPIEQKHANISEMGFIEQRLSEISKQPYLKSMSLDPEIEALQNRRSQLITQNKQIQKGLSSIDTDQKPIEIEKVWRGKNGKEGQTQTMNMAIEPETNTTLSYDNSQPVIGNYFIKLITPNGNLENLDSIQGFKSAPVYYSPNFGKIRQDYAAFHNRFGSQPSYEDNLNDYIKSKAVKNG